MTGESTRLQLPGAAHGRVVALVERLAVVEYLPASTTLLATSVAAHIHATAPWWLDTPTVTRTLLARSCRGKGLPARAALPKQMLLQSGWNFLVRSFD